MKPLMFQSGSSASFMPYNANTGVSEQPSTFATATRYGRDSKATRRDDMASKSLLHTVEIREKNGDKSLSKQPSHFDKVSIRPTQSRLHTRDSRMAVTTNFFSAGAYEKVHREGKPRCMEPKDLMCRIASKL